MNWKAFEEEISRVLRTSYRVPELKDETAFDGVDSLGIVEFVQAAEEHLGVELGFDEIRKCDTYADLKKLIEGKASQ